MYSKNNIGYGGYLRFTLDKDGCPIAHDRREEERRTEEDKEKRRRGVKICSR